MWWQIQRDFSSLFNRHDIVKNHFHPIDGLRAIASLLIISCHLVPIFGAFIPSYPHVEWREYLNSRVFALTPLMSFALEIFFMLSAFLLTHKLITQWMNNNDHHQLFLQQYPMSILKRALRFWPGMLLATVIMFVCGEPHHLNSGNYSEPIRYLSVWLFFQNYVDFDYWLATLAPLWTNSLDMQVHILLPLLLYFFYSYRKYISIYNSLAILLLLSLVLSAMAFNPKTMPIISTSLRYHLLPFLTPAPVCPWLKSNYNLTFPFECQQSNPFKLFIHKMNFPLEARFGSFIIGAMLAIQIIHTSHQPDHYSTFKKFAYLGSIFLHMLLTTTQNIDSPPPSDLVLKLVIASSRQIFTIGQAFILYTALCPSSHPYHSPWIRRFLSSPIWIPISKLSYLVYLIHWRIAFEFIFGGPLLFLREYSITYAVILALPIILFISQLISCIWFLFIEKPCERVVHRYLNTSTSTKIHSE